MEASMKVKSALIRLETGLLGPTAEGYYEGLAWDAYFELAEALCPQSEELDPQKMDDYQRYCEEFEKGIDDARR